MRLYFGAFFTASLLAVDACLATSLMILGAETKVLCYKHSPGVSASLTLHRSKS